MTRFTRWRFQLLAVPLIMGAVALMLLRPDEAYAQTAPVNTQNYGAIARTALTMLNQTKGECFPWVRAVVQTALGRVMGNDYHQGYLQAGGIEVPLVSARNGDIIQVTNPANTAWNADYVGLHTAIVLDNMGNGKFRVIDANSNYDGVVRIRENYSPTELSTRTPGLVVRAYRIEGAPGVVTPVIPPAPSFATTGTLPSVGQRVIVAADGDCLRVRSAPGLNGGVLGCMPTGAPATVTQSGPSADGYRWVQVSYNGLSGWAAADYLSAGPAGGVTSASAPVAAPAVAPSAPVAAPILAPAPVVVSAPVRGSFAAKPVFGGSSGQAAAVFVGNTVDQMIEAATDARASGVWVQDARADFHLLIVGGPSFILDAFRTKLQGFAGPTAVTLIGNAS